MCPACLTTMSLWLAVGTSAGGLGWVILGKTMARLNTIPDDKEIFMSTTNSPIRELSRGTSESRRASDCWPQKPTYG